jgi:hypothetical protein
MPAKRYPCGVCGKPDVAEKMIFSRFTGSRYCADLAACAKRAKRKTAR